MKRKLGGFKELAQLEEVQLNLVDSDYGVDWEEVTFEQVGKIITGKTPALLIK